MKNLHDISAIFFFILAFTYAIAALVLRNELMSGDFAIAVMQSLDIPFALVALMYGGSTLVMQLNENHESPTPWATVVIAGCILLFGTLVFINFTFPSQL